MCAQFNDEFWYANPPFFPIPGHPWLLRELWWSSDSPKTVDKLCILFFLLPFLWSNSYKVQNVEYKYGEWCWACWNDIRSTKYNVPPRQVVESRQLNRIFVPWYYHRPYLNSLLRILRRYEFNIIHQPPPTGSAPNKPPLPTCSVIYSKRSGLDRPNTIKIKRNYAVLHLVRACGFSYIT